MTLALCVVLGKKYIELGKAEVKRLGDESTFVKPEEIVNVVKAL